MLPPEVSDAPPIPLAHAAARSDVGRVREHNEDACFFSQSNGIFLVADGMGGHQAGDVASRMVRLSVRNFFDATKAEGNKPGAWRERYVMPYEQRQPVAAQRLIAAVRKANEDVFQASLTEAIGGTMGSTVVAIAAPADSREIHIAHVGDSRCYRFRPGDIAQLTRDHSFVNEVLAIDPHISAEDIARLPTNIITRALGIEPEVRIDVTSVVAEVDDVFLLCSDGLSGMLSDERMADIIKQHGDDLEKACEALVRHANEAGGLDNITAMLVAFRAPDDERVAPSRPSSLAVPDSVVPTGEEQLKEEAAGAADGENDDDDDDDADELAEATVREEPGSDEAGSDEPGSDEAGSDEPGSDESGDADR